MISTLHLPYSVLYYLVFLCFVLLHFLLIFATNATSCQLATSNFFILILLLYSNSISTSTPKIPKQQQKTTYHSPVLILLLYSNSISTLTPKTPKTTTKKTTYHSPVLQLLFFKLFFSEPFFKNGFSQNQQLTKDQPDQA